MLRLFQRVDMPKVLTCVSAILVLAVIANFRHGGLSQVHQLLRTDALLYGKNRGLSFELWDAPPEPTARMRVAAWLVINRSALCQASKRFKIPSRLITAVIAYEGLVDTEPGEYAGLADYSGPGKVHYKSNRFSEGDPVSAQVERIGLLPRRSMLERRTLLATPVYSTLYIAAIMHRFGELARIFRPELSDPAMLTLFSGYSFDDAVKTWESHRLVPLNEAGIWLKNNQAYVTQVSSHC